MVYTNLTIKKRPHQVSIVSLPKLCNSYIVDDNDPCAAFSMSSLPLRRPDNNENQIKSISVITSLTFFGFKVWLLCQDPASLLSVKEDESVYVGRIHYWGKQTQYIFVGWKERKTKNRSIFITTEIFGCISTLRFYYRRHCSYVGIVIQDCVITERSSSPQRD